jgi:alpha-methylacyl-CoA racemase
MSVGCIEPQFFKAFIEGLAASLPVGFSIEDGWIPSPDTQGDRAEWPRLRQYVEKAFLANTRDYWTRAFHGKPFYNIVAWNNISTRY